MLINPWYTYMTNNQNYFGIGSTELWGASGVGYLTHPTALVIGLCPNNGTPTNAQKYILMDSETGVTVNKTLSVMQNLGVSGVSVFAGTLSVHAGSTVFLVDLDCNLTCDGLVKCGQLQVLGETKLRDTHWYAPGG